MSISSCGLPAAAFMRRLRAALAAPRDQLLIQGEESPAAPGRADPALAWSFGVAGRHLATTVVICVARSPTNDHRPG
jgi:hypothetical protein